MPPPRPKNGSSGNGPSDENKSNGMPRLPAHGNKGLPMPSPMPRRPNGIESSGSASPRTDLPPRTPDRPTSGHLVAPSPGKVLQTPSPKTFQKMAQGSSDLFSKFTAKFDKLAEETSTEVGGIHVRTDQKKQLRETLKKLIHNQTELTIRFANSCQRRLKDKEDRLKHLEVENSRLKQVIANSSRINTVPIDASSPINAKPSSNLSQPPRLNVPNAGGPPMAGSDPTPSKEVMPDMFQSKPKNTASSGSCSMFTLFLFMVNLALIGLTVYANVVDPSLLAAVGLKPQGGMDTSKLLSQLDRAQSRAEDYRVGKLDCESSLSKLEAKIEGIDLDSCGDCPPFSCNFEDEHQLFEHSKQCDKSLRENLRETKQCIEDVNEIEGETAQLEERQKQLGSRVDETELHHDDVAQRLENAEIIMNDMKAKLVETFDMVAEQNERGRSGSGSHVPPTRRPSVSNDEGAKDLAL